MSLFGTKRSAPRTGPRPVWPYFAIAVACVFAYALPVHALWPWDYPQREDLVKTGGDVRAVTIRDHLSDTGAVAAMAAYVSAYIRFKDLDGEYEYPWSHPRYSRVGYHVAVHAEILVEKTSLEGPGPYKIWSIKETNPYKSDNEQTIITYEEIVDELIAQQKSLATMLKWLGAGTAFFCLWGWRTIRWNRRNYPPPTA